MMESDTHDKRKHNQIAQCHEGDAVARLIVWLEETEDEDLGEPLSLDEIFSPHFTVRHFHSAWIDSNKRMHCHVILCI